MHITIWEYSTLDINRDPFMQTAEYQLELTHKLNSMGSAGWELVSANAGIAMFKRNKNYFYYKWQTASADTSMDWRVVNKREFGETIKAVNWKPENFDISRPDTADSVGKKNMSERTQGPRGSIYRKADGTLFVPCGLCDKDSEGHIAPNAVCVCKTCEPTYNTQRRVEAERIAFINSGVSSIHLAIYDNERLTIERDAARAELATLRADAAAVVQAWEAYQDPTTDDSGFIDDAILDLRNRGPEGWWK